MLKVTLPYLHFIWHTKSVRNLATWMKDATFIYWSCENLATMDGTVDGDLTEVLAVEEAKHLLATQTMKHLPT